MSGEEMQSGMCQPALLAVIHCVLGSAEDGACAKSHFHEDPGVAVPHDEVYFPATTPVVAPLEHQSAGLQEAQGQVFGSLSLLLVRCLPWHACFR